MSYTNSTDLVSSSGLQKFSRFEENFVHVYNNRCELTQVSAMSATIFAIAHACFFVYFLSVHIRLLRHQLNRNPRDVLNNKVPFKVLYVLNVYSYFTVLNAGLVVTKGIKLTNVLQVSTPDGHCLNIADWLDWFFHTTIDLSIMLSIISVNSSTKRIIVICNISMLVSGLLVELTDRLAIQLPFFFIGGLFFLVIFSHVFTFYQRKKFFNKEIEGLIRGMVAIVVFVWTLYPVMFICINVIWRDQWKLSVRDSCVAALYITSKFGFNFLFLAWDKRFQKLISTDVAFAVHPGTLANDRKQSILALNEGIPLQKMGSNMSEARDSPQL